MLLVDIREAWRSIRRRPALSATAITILAVGIGANTAAFGVVYATLIRELPFPVADRLVRAGRPGLVQKDLLLSAEECEWWRSRTRSFDDLAAFESTSFTLTSEVGSARVSGARVSDNLHSLLGARVLRGRMFQAGDGRSAGPPAAVLSYSVWRDYFQLNPRIIGTEITLDETSYSVVGVIADSFAFPVNGTRIWVPLTRAPRVREGVAQTLYYRVIARLRPGVTPAQAQAEGDVLLRWAVTDRTDVALHVVSLREYLSGPARPKLYFIQGAVILVLLIASANVAFLLVAAGAARRTEMATRMALGASGGTVIRQSLFEALLLALAAAVGAIPITVWTIHLLQKAGPSWLPVPQDIAIGVRLLAFDFAVGGVTALLVGATPALLAARTDPGPLLSGGRHLAWYSSPRAVRWSTHLLTAGQIALSFVLLAMTMLLLKSVWQMLSKDLGYDPKDVVAVRLTLPASRYPNLASRHLFFDTLLRRLDEPPQFQAVGLVNQVPLSGEDTLMQIMPDHQRDTEELPMVGLRIVSPGYFEVMRSRLLKGRVLKAADRFGAPPVVVVNEPLARSILGSPNAVGRQVQFALQSWEVVGVIDGVKHRDLTAVPRSEVYVSYGQMLYYPVMMQKAHLGLMEVVIRTKASEGAALSAAERAVATVDPRLVPDRIIGLRQLMYRSLEGIMFPAGILAFFAAVAASLAVAGLYGALSFRVTTGARDIALRLALGATPGRVKWMLLGSGLAVASAGVAMGIPTALVGARMLRTMVPDVAEDHLTALIAAAVILSITAVAASYVPARRAVEPETLASLRAHV